MLGSASVRVVSAPSGLKLPVAGPCLYDAADPSTVRSQPVENDAPPQRMSWHEAMAELRARYAPPA